jgi:hypothetical protein
MALWDKNEDLIVRVVIGAAVGMLIGFGTCGLGAITGGGKHQAFLYVAWLGAAVFFICAVVLVISVLLLVVRGIYRIFRRPE